MLSFFSQIKYKIKLRDNDVIMSDVNIITLMYYTASVKIVWMMRIFLLQCTLVECNKIVLK